MLLKSPLCGDADPGFVFCMDGWQAVSRHTTATWTFAALLAFLISQFAVLRHLRPMFPDMHSCLEQSHRHSEAEMACKKALAACAGKPSACLQLAKLLLASSKHQEALNALKQGTQHLSQSSDQSIDAKLAMVRQYHQTISCSRRSMHTQVLIIDRSRQPACT